MIFVIEIAIAFLCGYCAHKYAAPLCGVKEVDEEIADYQRSLMALGYLVPPNAAVLKGFAIAKGYTTPGHEISAAAPTWRDLLSYLGEAEQVAAGRADTA